MHVGARVFNLRLLSVTQVLPFSESAVQLFDIFIYLRNIGSILMEPAVRSGVSLSGLFQFLA